MLSRFRDSLFRLIGSTALPPGDAAVAWALFQLVLTSIFALWFYSGVHQPHFLYDPAWMELAFKVQSRIIAPLWLVLLIVAWQLRKRDVQSVFLAHLFLQLTVLVALWGAFFTGLYTNLFGLGAFFGVTTSALVIFDASVVRGALITFVAGFVVLTLAEQLELLPYAPLIIEPPVLNQHLESRYLIDSGSQVVLAVATIFVFVGVTQRLRRATSLIQRYIPSQLAEKILAGEQSGAVHPERRKLTLFFSDVVGFTAAADRMEAEELSALLNEYLSEMAKIAERFGGTINQFIGDGIMIFFGAPEAITDRDHALRAVRMAIEMQQRMAELGEKWYAEGIQTPFRIRIGINTGVASVGDFGSEGRTIYSAIGNQVNLTARIQEHCEPGKILVSHTTWGLVKDEIPCEERGEIEVKGLHYPVRVYEVLEAPDQTRTAV